MSESKTPLADAVVAPYIGRNDVSAEECDALLDLARSLETDRAELIEALRAIVDLADFNTARALLARLRERP